MHRSKRKRNIIIFSLVGVLLCMVAGYAAFQTQLKVTGSSTVTSNWDIEITHVTEGTPTGSAENTVAPSFDKLWASMEANLYDKGDAMEYDVTIENKGTLDAKLNDILTNLDNSNSDAVIITFSGYTKGEILKSGESKIVHVKIEYNPEYEGGETSSEVEINFDYTQNNNETTPPESTYLLTYDYSTNGGTSVETTEEYVGSGNEVDLSNTATKEGWTFVGWNTDKDAQIGLKSYQMPTGNTTLYAIYSKTLKVTYEKGDNIDSIGKNEDSCNIYNNVISCEITLPEITATDDSSIVGWYNGKDKIGNPNDKYTIDKDITLIAKAEGEPYMMARDDNYAFWAEEYRTKIKTIDFVDNKNVPDNAVASWDVSDKKDKSVMAWIINDPDNSGYYKLYIGGTDGVIANKDCSYLFAMFTETTSINFNDNFDTSRVTTMEAMFNMYTSELYNNSYGSLTTLDLSSFDTSNVTNMHDMFASNTSLTELNISTFNTSNVTDMGAMFHNCYNLNKLTVDNFNTAKVTDMSYMFSACIKLSSIDISNFDTSNVTTMQDMFSMWDWQDLVVLNNLLTEIKGLETFDTSNVTNMNYMFAGCNQLTHLDISNFNTSKVTTMDNMFARCSKLSKLKLCSFDTSNVKNMNYMFYNTTNLKAIYVSSNWTTANAVTGDMFTNSAVSNVTQSDNCEVDAEDISLEISTTSTTNSVTVIASAYADSGIAKYEYSKDGGKTWEESTSNTYTFTGLATGTSYDIKVRVTSNIGKTLEKGATVDITDNVVTMGDGLYEDEYEDGRYVYRGINPNNYIWFNDEMWRIIAKEADGTYKIMKNESIGNLAWDTTGGTYGSNDWNRESDLNTYLNETYLSTITTKQDIIVSHTWGIGKIIDNNSDLAGQIAAENGTIWTGKVGLMSASDYLKANTNIEQCGNMNINNNNKAVCIQTNWIFKIIPEYGSLWTISSNEEDTRNVFSISGNASNSGWINMDFAFDNGNGVAPVLYLNSNITLSGTGSYDDPFEINKISTSTLEKPTFTEADTDNGKKVTITYPNGCGSSLTCSYQKDNGETVNVTSGTVNIEFTDSGSLVANVSDGTNNVSSSYTVSLLPYTAGPATNVIAELASTNTNELYIDDHDDIRYYGASPNNYVTFNNELWRIIGVIDGKIKIIRNESIGNMQWNSSTSNNWNNASLKKYLNEDYYNSIESISRNMISQETYYLGGATNNNFSILTASNYYDAERDSSQVYSGNPASTTQHIGLMYPSDYGYAAGSGCLSTTLNSYSNDCKNTDYLFSGKNEWLQSPHASGEIYVAFLGSTGYVLSFSTVSSRVDQNYNAVRPVLYLNSNVQITGGDGSSSNPFTLAQ